MNTQKPVTTFRGRREGEGPTYIIQGSYTPKLSLTADKHDIGKPHIIEHLTGFAYAVDPNSVEESTGIFDKNGKEAFDGDIIVNNNGGRFMVYWDMRNQWCLNEIDVENIMGGYAGVLVDARYITAAELKWEIV